MGGCGVPGRANSSQVYFLFLVPRRALSALPLLGVSQGHSDREEGMRKSYLLFLCFTLSRTPPPARPLLALPPAFSEMVIKKLLSS
jgi:hypothetical protein